MDIEKEIREFQDAFNLLTNEIGKVIVGQEYVVQEVLIALFAGGHILLEGVPGLGKTMLVKTLANALELKFSRIQFTPDLMPADIVGTDIVVEDGTGNRTFQFRPGPIHSQVILADEINRATPKTQSALLEAMQEHSVTVSGKTYKMEEPFFVLATQNPIEMEGTYPLPEAQVDRFLFKTIVKFPKREELAEILARTTDGKEQEINRVMDGSRVRYFQELIPKFVAAPHVKDFAIRIVMATHPEEETAPDIVKKFVRYGSSPRGAQALLLAAKVVASINGRVQVAFEDIERVTLPALRHRVLLNFEGEAEGISTDTILEEILKNISKENPNLEGEV